MLLPTSISSTYLKKILRMIFNDASIFGGAVAQWWGQVFLRNRGKKLKFQCGEQAK